MSSCQSSKTALEADKAFVLRVWSRVASDLVHVVATNGWTVCINTRQGMHLRHLFRLLVFSIESEGRPPEPPGESGDVGAELPGTVCTCR